MTVRDLTTDHLLVGPEARTLRLYAPATGPATSIVVFAHGGGFVWGTLDDYDRLARNLASATGGVVAAIDYRLAPGHPFPAAVDDLHEALLWAVARRIDLAAPGAPLILAGDSAGGCLAAGLSLRLAAEGGPQPEGLLLIYPMIEHHSRTPQGFHDLAQRFVPSHAAVQGAWEAYLASPDDSLDPVAVPTRASDFAGLPPALVITAAQDPLRFEAEDYARRLAQAGVPVRQRLFEGVGHSFMGEPEGAPCLAEAVAEIRGWVAELRPGPIQPAA